MIMTKKPTRSTSQNQPTPTPSPHKAEVGLALEWFLETTDSNSVRDRILGESRNLVLKQLKKILLKRLSALDTRSDDFTDPSWAYRQAYENGTRQVLRDLIKLMSFVE